MKPCYAVNQKVSLKSERLLQQVAKRNDCKKSCRMPKKAQSCLKVRSTFPVANSRAKGQLVFEFLIAVLIFFGIVFYTLNYLSWTVSGYSSDFSAESMESKASQIGEMLVLNGGTWSGGSPITPGLAEGWPVLNSSKISWLNASCNSDYEDFVRILGLNPGHRLKLTITETQPSGAVSVMADCRWGLTVTGNVTKAETKRYALSESGNMLGVKVVVWTTGR